MQLSSVLLAVAAFLPAVLAVPSPVSFGTVGVPNELRFPEGKLGTTIVGGVEVSPKFKYDFIVALKLGATGSPFCAGTLISRDWVLTAAHCSTLSYPVTSLRASSHRHDILLSSAEEEGEDLEISEVLVHPLYDAYRIDYDVALWKLKAPATTGNIVPFVDTKGSYSRTGTDAISIGWGATREGGAGSTVLREVTVPILDQSECNSKYYIGQITERMTCAGFPEGAKDACQGDSGGPMFTLNQGQPAIVGIVSWGYGCARAGYPGVYTNVSSVWEWVRDQSGVVRD